jgi:hypothetical protein
LNFCFSNQNKFSQEERRNRSLVDKALRERQGLDRTAFQKAVDEEEAEQRKKEEAATKKKKRGGNPKQNNKKNAKKKSDPDFKKEKREAEEEEEEEEDAEEEEEEEMEEDGEEERKENSGKRRASNAGVCLYCLLCKVLLLDNFAAAIFHFLKGLQSLHNVCFSALSTKWKIAGSKITLLLLFLLWVVGGRIIKNLPSA